MTTESPEVIECADCWCDATNDRACNGDGVIRCNSCDVAKYKKDCPFWFISPFIRKPILADNVV